MGWVKALRLCLEVKKTFDSCAYVFFGGGRCTSSFRPLPFVFFAIQTGEEGERCEIGLVRTFFLRSFEVILFKSFLFVIGCISSLTFFLRFFSLGMTTFYTNCNDGYDLVFLEDMDRYILFVCVCVCVSFKV